MPSNAKVRIIATSTPSAAPTRGTPRTSVRGARAPLDVVFTCSGAMPPLSGTGVAPVGHAPIAARSRGLAVARVRAAAAAGPRCRRACRRRGCGPGPRHPSTAPRPVASAIQVAASVSTTFGGVPRVCRGPSTTCTAPNGGTRTSTELPGRLLGEQLQQVAHGCREIGAGGEGCLARRAHAVEG